MPQASRSANDEDTFILCGVSLGMKSNKLFSFISCPYLLSNCINNENDGLRYPKPDMVSCDLSIYFVSGCVGSVSEEVYVSFGIRFSTQGERRLSSQTTKITTNNQQPTTHLTNTLLFSYFAKLGYPLYPRWRLIRTR